MRAKLFFVVAFIFFASLVSGDTSADGSKPAPQADPPGTVELPIHGIAQGNPAEYSWRAPFIVIIKVYEDPPKESDIATYQVPFNNIRIEMRKDGGTHTSAKFSGQVSESPMVYNSAVILVPVEDDLKTWSGWLNWKKGERDTKLRRPRRVTPKE